MNAGMNQMMCEKQFNISDIQNFGIIYFMDVAANGCKIKTKKYLIIIHDAHSL